HDVPHDRSTLPDCREPPRQRVRAIDLVVPVRADEQEMSKLGLDQHALQQVECRHAEPLQIIEEQRQRVLGAGEYADEFEQGVLESYLRGSGRDLWHRRLFSDDELELGNEVGDERTVRVEYLTKL